jgi:hypothetical protein
MGRFYPNSGRESTFISAVTKFQMYRSQEFLHKPETAPSRLRIVIGV